MSKVDAESKLEDRWPIGSGFKIEHDGFIGYVIGYYERRDGKRGIVGQHYSSNIVHVYGEKWLTPFDLKDLEPVGASNDIR